MNEMKIAWNIAGIAARRWGGNKSEYFAKSLEIVRKWHHQGCDEKVIMNRFFLSIMGNVENRVNITYCLGNEFNMLKADSYKEVLEEIDFLMPHMHAVTNMSIEFLGDDNQWIKFCR